MVKYVKCRSQSFFLNHLNEKNKGQMFLSTMKLGWILNLYKRQNPWCQHATLCFTQNADSS